MPTRLTITITDEAQIETVENAFAAVESDLDAPISSGRGRPADDELTTADAVTALASAYTGWRASGDQRTTADD